MAYYTLPRIKKNFTTPTGTSIDTTLDSFGEKADAWVDSILGQGTALSTTPVLISHIASDYAAGQYLSRVKDDPRGEKLMASAEKELRDYMKGPGHITGVFG